MHALFFLKHSRAGDEELRFALRGIAQHCPYIEKVWIFGDRPHFLASDTRLIEHVPHSAVAGVGKFKTPVKNFFLLTYLSSLIPGLAPDYLRFADDYMVIRPLPLEVATRHRYLEDLSQTKHRGRGLWKDSLWRTFELLKRLGYPGYNFETHTPTYYTKQRVLAAYLDFQDYVTEDRWQGMLGPTAIMNQTLAREGFALTRLADEGLHAGFHFKAFTHDEIAAGCQDKTFLNFDDEAYNEDMRRFLTERFPEPCKFERSPPLPPGDSGSASTTIQSPIHPHPSPLPRGEGARKTILFALELGGGWGHLGVIQPLAKTLIEQGHRVVVATPQLTAAKPLLSQLGVELIAAPTSHATPSRCPLPRTFAQVLLASCFGDADEIAARCSAWQALYQFIQPNTVICDHAPTALLAARATHLRHIALGQGFTLPAAVEPLPDWRPVLGPASADLARDEARVLDLANGYLASRKAPLLSRLADLYHTADGQWLLTYPELDCFASRNGEATYLGVSPAGGGASPVWPASPGKRVLAYLKPFPALGTLLEQLRRLKAASLVVAPDIPEELATPCAGTRVCIVREPVDLVQAAAQSDVAIGNATHGFTATVLAAGKPQLLIPIMLEQHLTADRVVELGCGTMADARNEKDVVQNLRKVWEKGTFASAAQAAAKRIAERRPAQEAALAQALRSLNNDPAPEIPADCSDLASSPAPAG